jgi:DNA-binding transcriptional MocR family regulator
MKAGFETQREPLLYERVAALVERMIEQGVLQPGEKAPSVRALSRKQQVSVSTAFQAYYQLEIRGLLEARPRSGFYVRAPRRGFSPLVMKSAPALTAREVKIYELVTEFLGCANQADVVPLAAAAVEDALLPAAKLQKFLLQELRKSGSAAVRYDFSGGLPDLRRAIARRAATDWNGNLAPDELVITTGCSESLLLALRAVARAGEVVAVESPAYFGVLQTIESLDLKALEIATDPDTGICLDALERALESEKIAAVITVSNFGNPLGSLIPDEKKKNLVELLARHEIPLIEDDVYGDLHFGTERPKTAKTFDESGLVLLCSSFSKTLAPGYRIGWIAGGRFHEKVFRLKQMSSHGTSLPPQMAISAFLQSGNYDQHLRRLRAALSRQIQLASKSITEYFPAGTRISHPKGGSVLWVELPASVDSVELFRDALREKIGIVPGVVFSTQNKYRNFIRLSCGNRFDARIEAALRRLGELAAAKIGPKTI